MRYFKYDLWVNDSEEEWNKKSLQYSEYFKTIKSSFSEDFLKVYYDAYGFHDYKISEILMTDNNSLILELIKKDKTICLEYGNVRSVGFNSNLNNTYTNMQISEYLEWGYDEFYRENDLLIHSVLTSCGLEFVVSFKNISVRCPKEIKHKGTILCVQTNQGTIRNH